jgi:hypothetical protein
MNDSDGAAPITGTHFRSTKVSSAPARLPLTRAYRFGWGHDQTRLLALFFLLCGDHSAEIDSNEVLKKRMTL